MHTVDTHAWTPWTGMHAHHGHAFMYTVDTHACTPWPGMLAHLLSILFQDRDSLLLLQLQQYQVEGPLVWAGVGTQSA